MWRTVVVLALVCRVASADELDEPLYHCGKHVAEVEVTFKPDAELKDLVTWAMGFTCRNFALPTSVISLNKKVMLVVPNRLTPQEAYRTFLVALATMGLTVVQKGDMYQIVEAATARHDTVPIYHKDLPPTTELVVRFVYRAEHAQPDTMNTAFTALKSDAGDIQVLGSLLVITDYASHIHDMLSLAKLVDVAGAGDGIYTIPVLHASATQLAQEMVTLLGATLAASGPAKPDAAKSDLRIMVDERTNTLLVSGSEAGYMRVAALVNRLDIALASEAFATFHVYPVKSAIAEELAKTLTDAIQGQAQQNAQKKAAPAPTPTPTDSLGTLEGQVKVMADNKTNKLIVVSSARDYLAIKDVLQQLDEPRRQVYIEATILEVELDNELDLGASFHGGIPTQGGKSLLVGGLQTPNLKSLDLTTLGAATGLIGGLVGGPLAGSESILGKSIPSYGLLIQALANRSTTQIMQAPSLTALDNETVSYDVGVNVPYKKGVIPTNPTSPFTNVTTNIDRKPLDLKLEIKPHISTNDTVLLEIKHSSEDLGADLGDLGPTWTTRTLETRVVVHDQSTVFIGGMMQTHEVTTEDKIPILGDVPLLGRLFKYTTHSKKKHDLMIMLTPYIVKDDLDLQQIRARKVREHDEFVTSVKNLEHMVFEPHVDYGRKRGVVEEINRAMQSVDEDVAALHQTEPPPRVTGGAI